MFLKTKWLSIGQFMCLVSLIVISFSVRVIGLFIFQINGLEQSRSKSPHETFHDETLDNISKFLFPVSVLLFCTIYWLVYMTNED